MSLHAIVLLLCVVATAAESPFACDPEVIRPGAGVPFYRNSLDELTYDEAEMQCRDAGAELLTLRELNTNSVIITDPPNAWLSGKRRHWIDEATGTALTLDLLVLSRNPEQDCLVFSSFADDFSPENCSSYYQTICVNDELGSCSGEHVFDFNCYFEPPRSILTHEQAFDACQSVGASLVGIVSKNQLAWLKFAFIGTFWTRYTYAEYSPDYYWYDGTRVEHPDLADYALEGCLSINASGQIEPRECDTLLPFVCVLEVPYASKSTNCVIFDEECLCLWEGDGEKTFNESVAFCLSTAGTLFYPDTYSKLDYLFRNITEWDIVWVGISDGYSPGVFRGSDTLVVTQVSIIKEYYRQTCVYFSDGGLRADNCSNRFNFICQSRPDPYLHQCTLDSGCLRAETNWEVSDSYSFDLPDQLVITDVSSLEICWDLCVTQTSFVCQAIVYNEQERECKLGAQTETIDDIYSLNAYRNRTRPDIAYCWFTYPHICYWDVAYSICSEKGPGWSLPTMFDQQLSDPVFNYSLDVWLDVYPCFDVAYNYKTVDGLYLYYSNWDPNDPRDTIKNCVVAGEFWRTADCAELHGVTCVGRLKDLCSSLQIENGRVEFNETSLLLQLTCLEGFYMISFNQTTVVTPCECTWLTSVENCIALPCPPLPMIPHGFYTTSQYSVNDTVTISCDRFYKISGTTATQASITCSYQNGTVVWEEIPTCEEVTCPPIQRADVVVVGDNESSSFEVGDQLTLRCADNLTVDESGSLPTEFNVTCSYNENTVNGVWIPNTTCADFSCPEAPAVPNASIISTSPVIDAVTQYSCDVGYYVANVTPLTSEFNITCVAEGSNVKWTEPASCQDFSCPEAPAVPNANIISTSTIIDAVTQYSCDVGYRVANVTPATSEFNITCVVEGLNVTWTEPASCEAVLCPEPPLVNNSQITVLGRDVGDVAFYKCDTGYIMSVETRSYWMSREELVECILDDLDPFTAVWNRSPECVALVGSDTASVTRQCPPPENVERTTVVYNDLFVDSPALFCAVPGYLLESGGVSASIVCSLGGQWVGGIPKLRSRECPPLPEIPGAIKSSDDYTSGSKVEIRCLDPLAKMENGLSAVNIVCTSSGSWNYVPQSCKLDRCGPFDFIEHSKLIDFNNTVNGMAVVMCDLSYRFIDGQNVKSFTCLSSLSWQPAMPCLVNACPSLRVPLNGTLSTYVALENTVVQVSCLLGFMFPDRSLTKAVECLSSFEWNDTVADCEVVFCPQLEKLSHGYLSSYETIYNSTITFTCDNPYRMEYGYNSMTIRCQENGQWSYPSLTCELGRCPPVPTIDNALPDTLLAVNGTKVTYTCQPGFVFPNYDPTYSIVCDGQDWDEVDLACSKIQCPQLNLSHATWTEEGRSFGDSVTFFCEQGYHYGYNITGTITCQANSTWSANISGCEAIDCGWPPNVLYSTHDISPDRGYGTVVKYRCLSGYWFERGLTEMSTACTQYGYWSALPTQCTPITCLPIPVWDDLDVNTTDNSVGAIVNISCARDGSTKSFVATCTPGGEWQPELELCPDDELTLFNPEPEEADGSDSIGVVVVGCVAVVMALIVASDMPRMIRELRGSR